MGTTTKMAIPYPEATGLVKDGWEDMKDIANQVDAKSGLVLINHTTFSAVGSQSVNSVFNSNYQNYRILIKLTAATADANINLKMRKAGVDTSTGYYMGGYQVQFTGTAGSRVTNNGSSWPLDNIDTSNAGISNTYSIDIFNPNTTANPNFNLTGYGQETNGTTYWMSEAGACLGGSEFDGFSLIASAGSISGRITTYGYNL